MRKLLYLAAGAALLSAPAAFAQNDSTASNQPSAVMGSSGTNATTDGQTAGSTDAQGADAQGADAQGADAQGNVVSAPAQDPPSAAQAPADAPPPDQAAPVDQGAAPSGAYDNQGQGQYSAPSQPAPNAQANTSSRLYVQNGEYQGQGIQIISNAPVPDTPGVRRMFPPLSRAGRHTAPAGN